jgi:hypothetical protein
MAKETRGQLYTYFETGDVPTADQFKNLIDSQINQESDGVTATLGLDGTNYIGIHNPNTNARLNITAGSDGGLLSLYLAPDAADSWLLKDSTAVLGTVSVSGGAELTGGLSLLQKSSSAETSRLFIQHDGKVGLSNTKPTRKLQLDEQNANDITGIKIRNTAVTTVDGWSAGHIHSAVERKDGAFVIYEEETGTNGNAEERFTILSGGNVGINEQLPDTTFHVSCDLSSPNMPVDLSEGTGIVMFGPHEENVVFDSSSMQARKRTSVSGVSTISPNALSLQPLGGDIIIHVDDEYPTSAKVIITDSGAMGLGTTAPVEKLDVDGAIKIADSTASSPEAGTIRYHDGDFHGYTGSSWQSFTEGAQVWLSKDEGNTLYFTPGGKPKVGIGTASPTAVLHIEESGDVTSNSTSFDSIAAYISNSSTTDSTGSNDLRVGLQIECAGQWSSANGPSNIGLYVSDVDGQNLVNENYAAVLNGSVVIGGLAGETLVGANGTHVLAIQDGAAPTAAPSTSTASGIQIYSAAQSGTSVFHVMSGDGKVIKLFQGAALTGNSGTLSDTLPAGDKTYIDLLKTRINELESRLKALGLLPNS